MAFLLESNLLRRIRSRFVRISIKAVEMMLLSAGLISTMVMVKGALTPYYSCEIVLSSLVGFMNSITCFLSSHIYVFINFIVMLIVISSLSRHRRNDDHHHQVADHDRHDVDYHHHDDHRYSMDKNVEYSIVTPQPPPPRPPPSPPWEVTNRASSPPSSADMMMSSLARVDDAAASGPPPSAPPLMTSSPRNVAGRHSFHSPSAPPMPSPPSSPLARDDGGHAPPPSAPPQMTSSPRNVARRHSPHAPPTPPRTPSSPRNVTGRHSLHAPSAPPMPSPPSSPVPSYSSSITKMASSTPYQGSTTDKKTTAASRKSSQSIFELTVVSESDEIKRTTYPALKSSKELSAQHIRDQINNDELDDYDGSMEATWKAITGGGKDSKHDQKHKKKHLKKSETWEQVEPPRRSFGGSSPSVRRLDSEEVVPSSPKWKELRKSETFNDAVAMTVRGGLIRRGGGPYSLSLKEFNQKVDGFIQKMRLQRQQSIRGYD